MIVRAAGVLPLAVSALALFGGRASAHNLAIDYFPLPDGRVRLEVYYSDGRPAAGADVEVRASAGAEVARGITDSQGAFEFAPPKGVALEATARHGGGHRADRTIPAGAPSDDRDRRGALPYGGWISGISAIVVLALLAMWSLRRRRAS